MEALRERFGKYHVLEKIAQGGMAEVYKVKTVGIAGFEKIQALKRILPHSAREGRFIRSFIDEARIAVELTHRNIVQVFDFGKADGELFLAMELIEGKDLRTAMAEAVARDLLPATAIAAYIVSEVAAGLDYAHRKTDVYGGSLNIVHCDVSPSNVMLSTDGYVKILDFGIARASFASALERRRLRGKPRYMAPEQTIGEPPTPASDVFALGIIAWELFTGRALYRGPDLKSILEAVRRTDPPPIDHINPSVPQEIVRAVATALSREPSARGAVADLLGACARTAMAAGARALEAWLAELEKRPSNKSLEWQPEVTSISVPSPDDGSASGASAASGASGVREKREPGPPVRPSARSVTRSLVQAPDEVGLADFGAGTPGFRDDPDHEAPTTRASRLDKLTRGRSAHRPAALEAVPAPGASSGTSSGASSGREPPRLPEPTSTTSSPVYKPFGPASPPRTEVTPPPGGAVAPRPIERPIEPTMSIVAPVPGESPYERPYVRQETQDVSDVHDAPRRPSEPPATFPAYAAYVPATASPSAQAPSSPPRPSPSAPRKLIIPPPSTGLAPDTEPLDRAPVHGPAADRPDRPTTERAMTEPYGRSSGPISRPSALRLDDEVTQHGGELPPVGPDATSYDDLEVEASIDAPGGDAAVGQLDEAIDDDLGALVSGLPAERRRTVVVAGVIAGAPSDVLRTVTRSLGELAYQRGGVVIGLDDDALLIAFGLEVAGEDDVAVAMAWALDANAMARDVGAFGPPGAAPAGLALRIGARTGVPAQAGPDGTPVLPQDAIDEAKALSREAAPDRPMFVGGAGRLTSTLYALREVPAPRRIARRSRVIEVVGPRSFDERDRARLERRGRFVGRAAQLAELETWLTRAIAGDRRQTVLISGAAGTGKSRLVAELLARVTETDPSIRVLTSAASPASHLTPFAMIVDLYQAALGLPPARGRTARALVVQRLTHLMLKAGVATERAKAIATDLDRAMELRDGVGLGARELADLRPRISAGLAKFRSVMLERAKPLITVVEDIHHADSASLEVLRHTLAVPANAPELLVLTARPEGPPPDVDAIIELGDLVGGELRALISDRLGDAATPANIAAVLARGGGNPLFIEELVEAVRDAGKRGEDVPASARDVVSARVERLSPKARAALRFAAVLGNTARARLLEELLGEESLEPELDELVRAGFLIRPATAAGSSEGELHFARGLVREVVHESLSARAQREGHARVGRLLASRFFAGREEPPATIAEHLERGGEVAGAAAFWLRAGRIALTASDAPAAVACFSRTLVLERELGPVPPTATSRARRREALAGREEAHRLIGDLASDPGDLDELQRLCEGEPARLADVSIRRAQRMLRIGDYAAAHAATAIAEEHAAAARDDRLRGEALRVRGEVLERLGRYDEALETVGAARELFHRRRLVTDEMAAMLGRGRIHLMRAHYEAARDAYRPVLALIEKTGDPWLERIATNHLALIDLCLGNFQRAMAATERSLDLCRRYGDRSREGDGLSVAGIILLEVGLLDDAAAAFAEALDILERTASRWSRADCLIYAGTCELRRGNPGGLEMLDEALSEARALGARYLESNALVTRAGAHLRRGSLGAAVEDAAAGAAVAQAATLVGYEIQGLARQALALARQGNRHVDAVALATRALSLLDRQRFLEGSEEEVFAACVEVLRTAGAPDRARVILDRARASAQRKLDALTNPAWRSAFLASPHVRELFA